MSNKLIVIKEMYGNHPEVIMGKERFAPLTNLLLLNGYIDQKYLYPNIKAFGYYLYKYLEEKVYTVSEFLEETRIIIKKHTKETLHGTDYSYIPVSALEEGNVVLGGNACDLDTVMRNGQGKTVSRIFTTDSYREVLYEKEASERLNEFEFVYVRHDSLKLPDIY